MADLPSSQGGGKPPHRGRIQAQGGGTEKSVPWAQENPPTRSDVLRFVEQLEDQLTPKEKRLREKAFAQLRRYIDNAAKLEGTWAPFPPKSFPQPAQGDIRVDLELHAGRACIPDEQDATEQSEKR